MTSHLAILTVIYGLLCAATSAFWLVPLSIVYACLMIWLHFRVYNNSCKPTLLEMLALFLFVATAYITTAVLFYMKFVPSQPAVPTTAHSSHALVRSFSSGSL